MDEPVRYQPLPSRSARRWAMLCHLSAFFGVIFPPFGNLIGPLVVWQWKKDDDPFIDQQGKEALNFQITLWLAMLVCMLLMLVLIGFALIGLVGIVGVVLTIIAAIKAGEGRPYRYPFTLRLLK